MTKNIRPTTQERAERREWMRSRIDSGMTVAELVEDARKLGLQRVDGSAVRWLQSAVAAERAAQQVKQAPPSTALAVVARQTPDGWDHDERTVRASFRVLALKLGIDRASRELGMMQLRILSLAEQGQL